MMSIVFGVLKLRTYLNKTSKFLLYNEQITERNSSLYSFKLFRLCLIKIYERTPSAARLSPKIDLLRDLKSNFQFVGSTIRYGSFSKKIALKNDFIKVTHSRVEKRLDGESINNDLKSAEVNMYLIHGKVSKAYELSMIMLDENKYPGDRILKKLLEKLIEKGNVVAIQLLGKHLNKDCKSRLYYHFRLSSSMVEAGLGKELVERAAKFLESSGSFKEENVLLTPGSLLKLLMKHPDLYHKVRNLIAKMRNNKTLQDEKLLRYINSLYEYNFLVGNALEAEKIYNEHLRDENDLCLRASVQAISHYSFKKKNVRKLEELLEFISRKPNGRQKMKGHIYSTYIAILREENKFKEALKIIKKSLNSIELRDYRRKALLRLKHEMQLQKLSFPYEIPHQKKIGRQRRKRISNLESDDDIR